MSGLTRRKSSIAVSQKTKIMIILKACIVNMGKIMGAAIKRSKM
jgi:hypothetical protein